MPHWNATLYDSKHRFVSQFAEDLVELLNPQPGEAILDLGCGTGHLTQAIYTATQALAQPAFSGQSTNTATTARVLGVDSAASMVAQAQANYPNLHFEVCDATDLQFSATFDAVFSNAVLHWIHQPQKVIAGVWHALKPGGRFVAEFGGKGNVQTMTQALAQILKTAGYLKQEPFTPWYFPSIPEYGTLLEQQGFELTFATLFDRPTPLEGNQGMRNWFRMFATHLLSPIPELEQATILTQLEEALHPQLYRDQTWFADYRRLRIVAIKPV